MALATVTDVHNLPPVLTVEQMRTILRISRGMAYELVHRRGFPALRFGRAIRIPRDAFFVWLAAADGAVVGQ